MTIKELILYGRKKLTNSATPEVDAELLLLRVLKCTRVFLKTYPEREISREEITEFEEMLTRRVAGEPVAYIVGERDFWTFSVMVSKDVLIPRPETELLVEKVLEKIHQDSKNCNDKFKQNKLNILDLGTGSGVIAIALALELPEAQVFAVDLSLRALEIASTNAKRNKVKNISFYHGDLFSSLPDMREKFAYIISNPPYIAQNDPHLDNKELRFEPKEALIAGVDGLDVLKVIIEEGQNFLMPQGWLLVEHGYDQAYKVQELFINNNYGNISSYMDLSGHLRVTSGCNIKKHI